VFALAAGKRGKEAAVRDLRQQFRIAMPNDEPVASHQPRTGSLRPLRASELPSADRAAALFLRESLRAKLAGNRMPGVPFSLDWFDQAQRQRHCRQAPWLPRLLEFHRHEGESLLGLGDGIGSDWVEYARCGSQVTVCSADTEQLGLVRLNFELRGLAARFRPSGPTGLPLEDASFDVACVLGLPARREVQTIAEVYRVLRPGGKIIAVLPAWRNVTYWQRVLMPWTRLFVPQFKSDPPARWFTAAELCREFDYFTEHRIHKRHLKRHEMPALWRGLPQPVAERLMGRFLIWKAFKAVRACVVRSLAA
jgi:SAM-dependent methyltransferase